MLKWDRALQQADQMMLSSGTEDGCITTLPKSGSIFHIPKYNRGQNVQGRFQRLLLYAE